MRAKPADADRRVPTVVGELDVSLPGPCASPCEEGVTHCINSTCVPVPPSCAGGGAGAGFNCGGSIDNTDDCCNWFDVSGGSFYRNYDGVSLPGHGLPRDREHVRAGRVRGHRRPLPEVRQRGRGERRGASVDPAAGRRASTRSSATAGASITGGNVTGADGGVVYEPGWDPSWNAYLPTTKADWDSSLTDQASSSGNPSLATWTPDPGLYENLPINCMTWYQAYAFCIWDGGFLPSSTEWNRAAAPPFPPGQRIYAWGNNNPDKSNRYAIWDWSYPGSSLNVGATASVSNIAPVGTPQLGRGLWGQLDLTGNVYEYTLDYSVEPLLNPCVDCADTQTGTQRLFAAVALILIDTAPTLRSRARTPPRVPRGRRMQTSGSGAPDRLTVPDNWQVRAARVQSGLRVRLRVAWNRGCTAETCLVRETSPGQFTFSHALTHRRGARRGRAPLRTRAGHLGERRGSPASCTVTRPSSVGVAPRRQPLHRRAVGRGDGIAKKLGRPNDGIPIQHCMNTFATR